MFPCTNNAAEYEALLHGLQMAKEMNLSRKWQELEYKLGKLHLGVTGFPGGAGWKGVRGKRRIGPGC